MGPDPGLPEAFLRLVSPTNELLPNIALLRTHALQAVRQFLTPPQNCASKRNPSPPMLRDWYPAHGAGRQLFASHWRSIVWSKNQIEPYRDFVKPYYAVKDPAHNFQYIERIINRLTMLSEDISQPIDSAKLYFLACFHGLGKQLSSREDFNNQVQMLLESLDWTIDEIEEVFQSLYRHLTNPQSIEEKIVHDANYIEVLGAFDIAKAFTTGGANGQSIEETANIFEGQYLDKVVFQTPVGKRLSEDRKNYTKEFLISLRKEW
jgi:uncharacterized protein